MRKYIEAFLLSPIYPVLLSAYPISILYSSNLSQISSLVLFRPLLLSILASILLFLAMRFIFREWHKAAFVAALVILFLSTYGHIEIFLDSKKVQEPSVYIFIGWLTISVFFVLLNRKFKNRFDFSSLAPSMNLMIIILLLYPLAKTIQYNIAKANVYSSQTESFNQSDFSQLDTLPDIYYIIPDQYGRSDVLEEVYAYDNSEFIDALEELGFYVAKCSQSNYPITTLSLASTLNMDYIPELDEDVKLDGREAFYLYAALENNSLKQILESAGYKTVAFANGFSWLEMKNTDIFLSPPPGSINEFEVMFLETTFIRFFDNLEFVDLENIRAERYRERTRLVFDSFSDLATMSGPKFAFIHIIAPHGPYGFDANGNSISPDQVSERDGYVNQATYVNKKIIESVKILLDQSDTPPIIIIQGDHGPWVPRPDLRVGILNAYYLPEHTDSLYPTISPVNTFRLILNEYFGEDYELLADNSYNIRAPSIYNFYPVENNCGK